MKALTWQGKRDVQVREVPDPTIQDPTDAIIRVTSSGICGSDLHLYEVLGPFMGQGDVLGHEPMGIVEEVGGQTGDLKVGDRVVIPFQIACGKCWMCERNLQTQCETTQVRDQQMGAQLFGYTKLYGEVPGAQAEFLRVPHADYTHIKVPHEGADDRYVYLSDVLPTAWQAVQYADVPDGGSVTVLGLGPIGDMACRIATHLGHRVIGVDLVPERLERVRARGIEVVDLNQHGKELGSVIREMTDGRGTDSVIDAVGMEAHGAPIGKLAHGMVGLLPDKVAEKVMQTAGTDRMSALYSAIDVARRGGTISLSGVYGGMADPMPMLTIFDKQLRLHMGQANVKRWADDILPLLTDEDPLGVDDFATHHISLDEAPATYEAFQKKEGVVKAVINP